MENIKFRDFLSIKYIVMILGWSILLIYITYPFSSLEIRDVFFYLLIMVFIGFSEVYSFSRKVVICDQGVTVSFRLFDSAKNNDNYVFQRKVWGYRFTFYFTIDNIRSVKILSSTEVKKISDLRFKYLANGKEAVLIEFIKPLEVRIWPLVIGKKTPITKLAFSVNDIQRLYTLFSNKLGNITQTL